jgi:hypothetical protein
MMLQIGMDTLLFTAQGVQVVQVMLLHPVRTLRLVTMVQVAVAVAVMLRGMVTMMAQVVQVVEQVVGLAQGLPQFLPELLLQ